MCTSFCFVMVNKINDKYSVSDQAESYTMEKEKSKKKDHSVSVSDM